MLRKYLAATIELTERITDYKKDVVTAKAHPKAEDAFVDMDVLGTNYTERKDAGGNVTRMYNVGGQLEKTLEI